MIQKTGSHHQLTLDLPLAPDSNDPFFKSDSHWPFQVVVKKYHLSRYIVCRFIQFDYYIWQRGGKGGPNHQLNYGFWSTFNRDHQDHFMLEFMREIQDVACFFGGFEGDFLKHMHQICGLVIFPHECFNQLHDLLEAWKLFKKRCRGSLMPRTGETSGFTYRRFAAGWSKMKIVTKHNPRSPRPRWSWSKEKYRSSWAFWLLIYPMLEGGWSTRFRGGISYLQKRWDHHSPCKELIDPGTDDESCELQVFEVKLTQNYVAPLKSRSYKLKCTFPPRNNDGSVENDSSFFF